MNYFYTIIISLLLTANLCAKPKVFISQIAEHPALDATRQGIYDELKNSNTDIDIIYECAQSQPILATQIAQKAVAANSDVAIAIGTPLAQALKKATLKQQGTAVVFASITDPVGSGLLQQLECPESNITGVSNFVALEPQLEFFKQTLPRLKNLGVIYNPAEANSIAIIRQLKKIAKDYDINIIEATANKTAEVSTAAKSLLPKTDAIYITNDNTALSAFRSIVKDYNKAKKPVFCSDTDMISQGAFAALGPDQYLIGRQVGKQVLELLNGNSISQIPVGYPHKTLQRINSATAKAIGISIKKINKLKPTRVST